MADLLLDLLSHIPGGIGIAYLVVGIIIVVTVLKVFEMFYEKVKERTLDEVESESQLSRLTESVGTLTENVQTIETKVDDLTNKQNDQQRNFDDKMGRLERELNDRSEFHTEIHNKFTDLSRSVDIMNRNQDLLIDSNKNNILSTITSAYYKAEKEGYVPMIELASLEKQYQDYLNFNGQDDFATELMKELREYPHHDPTLLDNNG